MIYCADAFIYDLGTDYWSSMWGDGKWWWWAENLLYNAGFMYTDAINYVYFTPETVPDGDFGFFTLYLAGDFVMRIFVADRTPNNDDEEDV